MNHPLTDEICRQIAPCGDLWSPTAECHDMRAAADWQLEQDAKFFAEYLGNLGPRSAVSPRIADLRAEWFKEAMRPQEDN